MLTYLRQNFEEVWGPDPQTDDGFEQKLLALKVLLESQSNNSFIGIDVEVLRKEVKTLSQARKPEEKPVSRQKEGGEPDFDPAQLVT